MDLEAHSVDFLEEVGVQEGVDHRDTLVEEQLMQQGTDIGIIIP